VRQGSGQFAHGANAGHVSEVCLKFLSAFVVFNLERSAVPPGDRAARIPQRYGAGQKTAILSVRPSKARFDLEKFAGHHRRAKLLEMPLEIVRVNDGCPG
jgi:hypothetical protein